MRSSEMPVERKTLLLGKSISFTHTRTQTHTHTRILLVKAVVLESFLRGSGWVMAVEKLQHIKHGSL